METNEEYVPEHLAEMLDAYAKFYQLDEAEFVHGKGHRKRSVSAAASAFMHICVSWRNTVRS